MPTQTPEQLQAVIQATGQQPAPSAITSSTLQPTPTTPYVSPKETPVYPVASLAPATAPIEPTPTETKANDLSSEIARLNETYVGQSDYRTQQESAQDITAKTQTVKDLTSRMTALKNEALAIPLQLQSNATGREMAPVGLQVHQTEALRNNAIQALSTNSLLEAANGNLTTAYAMVDRAVSQKFDPIKAEIAAKTANLELILKSPQYTTEQKNRAQAQLDIQTAKTKAIATQEQASKDIYSIAVDAAHAGGDSVTISRIQAAKTKEEALQIATSAGLTQGTGQVPVSAQEYNFAVNNGFKGSFLDYQTAKERIQHLWDKPSAASTAAATKPTFTTTQVNQGAANAAMDASSFKSLDGEVQNFYINSKPLVTAFNEAVAGVKDGSATATQVKGNIDAMAIPESVKAHLKAQVDASTPAAHSNNTGGAIGNIWSGIKDFLGI